MHLRTSLNKSPKKGLGTFLQAPLHLFAQLPVCPCLICVVLVFEMEKAQILCKGILCKLQNFQWDKHPTLIFTLELRSLTGLAVTQQAVLTYC